MPGHFPEKMKMKIKISQGMVDESMANAIDNGYSFDEWSAEEIARDIAEYDSQFEGVPIEEIIPLIKEWKEKNDHHS